MRPGARRPAARAPKAEPATIPALLDRRAAERGDQTFLYFRDRQVTYAELAATVDRVAAGLERLGVAPGQRVALLLPNCPEFLEAFFGVMRAGAAAVPINTQLKSEEVRYILQDSGAGVVVTAPESAAMVGGLKASLPSLRTILTTGGGAPGTLEWDRLRAIPGSIRSRPGPEDPAAIIYTSGTTGRPKGVILTHHNYLLDVRQFVRAIRMTKRDRFLCILPLFHVNGQVVTTLSPMYAGGAMILLERFSPKEFFPAVARFRATAFSGVPTVYAILMGLPDADQYDLSSLRFGICGAAPMPVEVFRRFEEKFGVQILEGYGLSEGTCVSSVNPLHGKRKIGSIGLPLPGQAMRIVDDSGRPRGEKKVGEIVIRGANVMQGYLNNPEATAQTIKNGWLHTGDLGYRDRNGYFYIVGRKKEMIIRGGENIYPKEVEEVLYRHPAVAEAAVVGIPDPVWGEEVWAFIVPREGTHPTPEELITYCRRHLAEYKSPKRVAFVPELPKTATGKIRKGELRERWSTGTAR